VAPDPLLHLPDEQAFITAAYQRLLGRMPDAQGVAYWQDVLQQGIAREAMLEALTTSEEHRAFAQQQTP